MMLTSGDRPDEIAAAAEQLGIAGYLVKPVKQSELFDAIAAALGIAAAEAPVGPGPAGRPGGPLPDILLAEDSLVNQKLAVGLLDRQGTPGHVGQQRPRGAGRAGNASRSTWC